MINPANIHEIRFQAYLKGCGFPKELKQDTTFLLSTRAAYIAGAGGILDQISEGLGPAKVIGELKDYMREVSDATTP